MKIKERHLKKIISTTLVNELMGVAIDDPEVATSISQDIQAAGTASSDTLPDTAIVAKKILRLSTTWKPLIISVVAQLYRYMQLKSDANYPGTDKYFHFLAFYTASRMLLNGGMPPDVVRFTLQNIGEFKELADKFKISASSEQADIDANNAGIDAALSGQNSCNGAFAQAQGLDTVGTLKRKAAAAKKKYDERVAAAKPEGKASGKAKRIKPSRYEWFDRYSWIWENESIAKFYSDNDTFMMPRHNCRLTPAQRSIGWKRYGKPAPSGLTGPLDTEASTINESIFDSPCDPYVKYLVSVSEDPDEANTYIKTYADPTPDDDEECDAALDRDLKDYWKIQKGRGRVKKALKKATLDTKVPPKVIDRDGKTIDDFESWAKAVSLSEENITHESLRKAISSIILEEKTKHVDQDRDDWMKGAANMKGAKVAGISPGGGYYYGWHDGEKGTHKGATTIFFRHRKGSPYLYAASGEPFGYVGRDGKLHFHKPKKGNLPEKVGKIENDRHKQLSSLPPPKSDPGYVPATDKPPGKPSKPAKDAETNDKPADIKLPSGIIRYDRGTKVRDSVKQIQSALKKLGAWDKEVTGKFDKDFRRALRSWQRSSGLAYDGIYGPKTQAKLSEKLKAVSEIKLYIRSVVNEVIAQPTYGDDTEGKGYQCPPGPGCPGGWSRFPKARDPEVVVPDGVMLMIQLMDPTGVSSWPDLAEAVQAYHANPHDINKAYLGLAIVGVIPLIGSGTKSIKAFNLGQDLAVTGTKVKSLRRFITRFKKASPSVEKAARSLVKVMTGLSKKDVDAIMAAAKWMDKNRAIYWLHLFAFYSGNAQQVISVELLDHLSQTESHAAP
jgi:hypothetical protein